MVKILILDDNKGIRQMLERRLTKLGYEVFTVGSAADARTTLENSEIQFILLDNRMPDISGFDFFTELNATYNIPAIMMTAHASLDLAVEFLKQGGADFVPKPIDMNVLHIKIQKILADHQKVERAEMARREIEKTLVLYNKTLRQKTRKLEEANLALESFTSSVAHDLKSPIGHISIFSSLLKEALGDNISEQAEEYLSFINTSAQKMERLITNLLALSKASQKEVEKTNINTQKMVENIILPLKQQYKTVAPIFEIEALPNILADEILINQVFENLIGNATKYSSKSANPTIKISSKETNEHWQFEISDNGVGFDNQYAKKIFDSFTRLHSEKDFQGTGIGLANVKKIVAKHKGRIWAIGDEGVGASFFFILPKK